MLTGDAVDERGTTVVVTRRFGDFGAPGDFGMGAGRLTLLTGLAEAPRAGMCSLPTPMGKG
jgi:hypothetical protein